MFFVTRLNSKTSIDFNHSGYMFNCLGFFNTKKEAYELVNQIKKADEYYRYLVIENIQPGFKPYEQLQEQIWFEFNIENQRYERIDNKPEEYEHFVVFSLR